MLENFTQRCAQYGHNNSQISGLCVNLECPSIPQACQTCNEMIHSDHIQDVKTSLQIKQYLQDQKQQITNKLSKYNEIWAQIQNKYKQFHSEIASQKLLILCHLKKQIEEYPNYVLKQLSEMIRTLKINLVLQDNVVNKNLEQFGLFFQFFGDPYYSYPFTFKPIRNQLLNPEKTKLKYKFLETRQIEIYPDLNTIQEPKFQFVLKVLEIKNNFQLMLSGELNQIIFSIDQDGILTDEEHQQIELGQKITEGTIIKLSFTFSGLKYSVEIEICQQNNDIIKHIHEFSERQKLQLRVAGLSDKGQLQILHHTNKPINGVGQNIQIQNILQFLENFTQKCEIDGHNQLQISGLCVNQECIMIPQACQTCNQQFHSDHIQDVKSSNQIRQYLQHLESQATNILNQYDKIWTKIQTRYKQFYQDIAYKIFVIDQNFKKDLQNSSNSDLKSLSDMIRNLKKDQELQEDAVNKNIKSLKKFKKFFKVVDYVCPFTFRRIEGLDLNPDDTILKYKFLFPEPIEIYPNIDKVQEPKFKFILKVLEIKKSFQLQLYSGALNESIFQIDQDGILTDNFHNKVELGQKITQGTLIILQFTFQGLKKSVKIEIRQGNNDKRRHIHKFMEKYKLRLVVFSHEGELQILHDNV